MTKFELDHGTPRIGDLINTQEASDRIGCHYSTMVRWRREGRGPRYYRLRHGQHTRYLYAPEDLGVAPKIEAVDPSTRCTETRDMLGAIDD